MFVGAINQQVRRFNGKSASITAVGSSSGVYSGAVVVESSEHLRGKSLFASCY